MFKPMGCAGAPVEKIEQILQSQPWQYTVEPKIDGSRYYMVNKGGEIHFYSRRTSVVTGTPVDKSENLLHISKNADLQSLEDSIIDGEIVHRLGFRRGVMRAMGSSPEVSLEFQKAEGFVGWVIFDVPRLCGEDLTRSPYRERRHILRQLQDMLKINYFSLPLFNQSESGYLSSNSWPIFLIPTSDEMYTEHLAYRQRCISEGYEGVVVKNVGSWYHEGAKPAWMWIKWKEDQTFDVVITGFVMARPGKWEGMIGAITFGQYVNGKLVELGQCSGSIDDASRLYMTEHQEEHIGKVMTITGQERTERGKIREPQFKFIRNDKDPKDCIFQEYES